MVKVVASVIAMLIGLCGTVGTVLALTHRDAVAVAVPASGCDRATAVYGLVGSQASLAVHADACRPPGRTVLLSEKASFDVLGGAAWRSPGRSLDRIEIRIDRSADQQQGRRTLVLTGVQASQRWGSRPLIPDADADRMERAQLNDVLWLCGFAVAGLAFISVIAVLARALRQAGVFVIWMR